MIKFIDIRLDAEEKDAVSQVLESGILAQGPKVKQFEEEFADFCGTEFAVAVNSGTAALHSALHAAGIRTGDEVITTPFTFVATANSIRMQGAKVIFADIKNDTFNIDPEAIKAKITDKTKAIIPVDLFGQIYDYKAIREIAEERNLIVIEDACQAVGAKLDNRKAGSFGDLSTFSFYATKNMMCGEGGMVATDNQKYIKIIQKFRHHGQDPNKHYEYYDLGYNYRMTDIAAAIGIQQLKKIDDFNDNRILNARKYNKVLRGLDCIQVPSIKQNCKHVYHQYTIKLTDSRINRARLIENLKQKGVSTDIFYPIPLHLTEFYRRAGYKIGDYPVAEEASRNVLSLPIHHRLTNQDTDFISTSLLELLKSFSQGL